MALIAREFHDAILSFASNLTLFQWCSCRYYTTKCDVPWTGDYWQQGTFNLFFWGFCSISSHEMNMSRATNLCLT